MREFIVTVTNGSLTNSGNGIMTYLINATAVNPNIELLRWWVGFSTNATSAQNRIELVQISNINSTLTNGSPFTPLKMKIADPNASILVGDSTGTPGTVSVLGSTFVSAAFTTMHADAFNVLNGWLHVPTPPETRILPAQTTTGTAQVALASLMRGTVSTTTGWSFGCIYREI